jgi:hypothetical protein
MTDPLKHNQKLYVAVEILEYLYMSSEGEAVIVLKKLLDINNEDLLSAAVTVRSIRDLVDNQRY